MRALRSLRQRPCVESLEARILYSADPVLAAFDAMPGVPTVERRVIDAPAPQPRIAPANDTAAAEARHELVLVDLRVSNWQELVDDIRRARGTEAEIVMLDPTRDGIEQISERLAQEHGLDAVHIVSHGEAGALQIGATQLDFDTLLADATAVSRWRLALNNGADLLLYGCDLAATSDGRSLVDAMSRLTGADVAASVDVTGGAATGGDWVLEYTTGSIQSEALANASDLAAWDGSLGITSPGTETRANTATSGSQTTWPTRRQVAIDGSGNFVIVWNDGSADDIYARRYDSTGSPLTSAFRVNTNTSSQDERAVVAMNSSGAFVVVWQSDTQDPGGNAGIYAQVYDATGAAVGGEFRVNQTTSDDQQSPSVSMDAAGNFVVSWTSPGQDNGSTYGVYARRFSATGTAQGNEFLVNTTTAGDQEASSVAVNASGDFVVAWQSTSGQDGNGAGIYARRYNNAGVAQTGELLVNTSTSGDQLRPSVAITANGDFMVAWSGAGTGGSGSDAYGQRFNSAGVKLGSELRLNTTTSSDQDYPVVAADSNGNYLATWESNGQDGGGWGVYGRLLSNNGSFLTNETLINTTTSGDQDYPSVAWNGTKAVFFWEGNGSGDSSGVYLKTFDVTVPGITVSAIGGNTTEASGAASFNVVLNSQPTANVTISIASSDTTEGTVSTSSLTFTSANWNVAQVVTVTGVDDAADDGDIAYSIITGAAASGDASYNGLAAADVAATNVDNDIAGVTVSAISGNTTEAGGTATFGVHLTSQPTADVTISIASNDTTEGTVSMSSLTFTAANWNAAQVVTVTGVDDALDDGNIAYSVVTGAATSADAGYDGMAVNDVAVTNVDNDTAGVSVSAIGGNTTEAGGSASFSVVLTSQPTADVTISVASNDTTEGTVSSSSLTFTSANWSVAQVVTVTGVDDALDDGNIAYSIVTGNASSVDAGYNGMAVNDVAVTNVDNDTAGVSVSAIGGNTTEAGSAATFSVVLTSQPTADVTISIASNDITEGTVSTSSLTFTTANWNVAQAVTVTGVDDAKDDGNIAYSIVAGAASSADVGYNGMAVNDVAVTNVDNDTAGVTVSAISGNTTEVGGTATFSVQLTSQPTADVTISISSGDTTEGTVSTSSLTFTAANWNVAQVVTAAGVDDALDDGDVGYSIVTGTAASTDAGYNGMAVNDVTVTNVDNDTAGTAVSAISGNTTEVGGAATFSVQLTSQPTANVTISIASSDITEGTVSTSSLTFTAANWNVAQVVTVTGVDDALDDGDIGYSIVTGAAASADAGYNGMAVADVAATNIDNDTAGIIVSAISGNTTEAGGTATFGVQLASQPTANVTISIASSNTAEGTVSASSLTFTAANWNIAQVVTVTGVDDALDDGDIAYSIVTGTAASTDAGYNGMAASDLAVTNVDNDSAGIAVTPISGNTTEAGGTATFSVQLTSQPTTDVTISVASSDTTEGTVSTSSLTFTAANWNVAQVVTVTGVDDALADGDIGYTIVTGAAASADAGYNGLAVNDVSLTNVDNDTASTIVSAISGPTTEAGGTATFSVVLASQPTADVTISIASSDTNEGTVSTSSLTFTAANWNVAQVVTVTGIDDPANDGNAAYNIVTGAATSLDADYNGLAVADVAAVNVDDDTAGITVSPVVGTTSESGATATFGVVLNTQPSADVTIAVASGNTAEGTVSTSFLTFTAANWNVVQTVSVAGVDDARDDGDVAYSIVTGAASSADLNYGGMAVADVAVTNVDNDTAGVSVSVISGSTTEAGGTATFNVMLTSQPTADVTISIATGDAAEGTASTSSLTFTAANWNVAQVVTVTGVDDAFDDGDISYSIVTDAAASADAGYNGLAVGDVTVTNVDNDSAGVTVSLISGPTTEAGGTATFSVQLTSQPTTDVTISIASGDATEGTPSTSSLTFTTGNWNVAQVVAITGVDDAVADGDIAYMIVTGNAASADASYNGLAMNDVAVTNVDNDATGVTVSAISGSTTEAGGAAIFSVVLTSQPTADVTISIASGDATEGAVSTGSLTFTAANWNVAQVVTVTGVDDALADGDIAYAIATGAAISADAGYDGMAVNDVAITNIDDDSAGVSVSATSGNTSEAGGTATFSVQLTSQPTADVTISVASSDTTEGTVSTSSLTFTAANWNVAQVVTVTGVDDALADGDIGYTIVTGAAASADAGYNGMAVNDVSLTNVDDDTASVSVSAISGYTTEAGGTTGFSVMLTSQPTADVSISVASNNTAEGAVSISSLTFTAANWNIAQVVTVTGVDDAMDDGDIGYSIVTGAASSADAGYNGMTVNDVAVTNVDNDTAGVSVSPVGGNTTEARGTAVFGVLLTSQPTADVTISITSSDTTEGTVSTASLTFTAANWNVAQQIVVTGVDDAVADGAIGYSVVTGAAASADAGYDGLAVADIALNNTDDDNAGITVSPISGNTSEAGAGATFIVVLNSQPTADVTVSIASSNPAEGTVSTSSLTFTAANWNQAQVVTVTGVDDALDDGDVGYSILTGAAAGADASYNGMAVGDVAVTNVDNDSAGVTVSAISGNTTEARGTATFSVMLTSQPTVDVTISIASGNAGEGTVSTSSLTFTAVDWNIAQIVTVTGVDDALADGDIGYSIVTGTAVSADTNYNGMAVGDVAATNLDDDVAGVAVSPISGNTTEAGGSVAFSVQLTSQPTADVTISVVSGDVGEGTVSTSSLTFTAANWNVTQVVTVTGVNDAVADGDVAYAVVTGAAASADAGYNGMAVADVSVTNVDNDTAGVTVSAIGGNTTEAGGTAMFSVTLTSQPTADVTISIASSNPGEGTVSAPALTFTAANWNVAQVVTVTGVDDAIVDGNVAYSVITGAATSADTNYDGMNAADVAVTNADDEQAPALALPGSLQVDEDMSFRLGDAGVSVTDVNADLTRIDLTVAHGGLTVSLIGGASVIAASADNRSISLTGTQAQLVDALTRITYRGDTDWFGADTLDISATDASGLQASHRAAINVAPINDAPVISSASRVDIPEGQVLVTQITSADVEGDTRHYAIVGGADAAQFVIDNNSGELRLRNAPDAEVPIDSNHDNVYEVTVEVVDSQGGTARQGLAVTVFGVNEAPSVTVSSLSVPSDGAVTLNQHQIVAHDVDSPVATLTFSVSGVVNGHFELVTQPGTAIASFSESALEAGLVSFVHEAGAPPPQFVIAVSDGQASSAPLRVQFEVSAGQPAPAPHVGTPSTSPPEHEPTPALAERAEPTPVRSAAGTPSVSRIETPDLPRPTPLADESTGAEFGSRSTARAFVFPLPAAASHGDEADGIFWHGDDPRRAVMLALHDDDSREAKELEAADMTHLGLAPVPAQEDALQLELGTVVLQTLGIALTAGSVWWALRAAGLVTALLASLPAWRQLDFLPVLAEEEDDDAPHWSPAEDAEAARDEAAVERDLFAEGALR